MYCTEDVWKASNPWWESGPEPKECEGCDENVEDELADDSDLCGSCLTTLEEM
jgi:hypothetical protein